jgi:hypothetical protein
VLAQNKLIQDYTCFPLWNRAIGGLPGTFFISLTQRRLSDKLTIQLALLKYLAINNKKSFTDLLKISPCYKVGLPRYRLLILDPGALNIRASMGIEPIVHQEVQECVQEIATNPRVTRLWTSDTTIPEDELISTLVSMRPYHARLATKIFRCSDAGILRIFCGLFEKTRSTVSLTFTKRKEEGKTSLISEARRIEHQWILDISKLWKDGNLNTFPRSALSWGDCTTLLAEQMREHTWGFKVHGETIPYPIEQTAVYPWDKLDTQLKERAALISSSESYQILGEKIWVELGPYLPYYRSSTQEKVRKTVTSQIEVSTQARATRRLGTIQSWAKYIQSNSLLLLIDQLLNEKGVTEVPSAPQVRGGNIYHRFHTACDKMSCLINGLSSINSHFSLGTTHMSKFSSGGEDYTIFCQSVFLYACWCLYTVYGHRDQERQKT